MIIHYIYYCIVCENYGVEEIEIPDSTTNVYEYLLSVLRKSNFKCEHCNTHNFFTVKEMFCQPHESEELLKELQQQLILE